ncbi:MAG: DUF2294 domain-containing protein [Planctomycetota bacterium]|jgi:uncharacterized protein YbcI|nr:DUF2294 domain-containing protein [Planctomycetota bacterium]MDP6504901.1 DUF2294 domain-containing protein [Planctomycetota bacterium]
MQTSVENAETEICQAVNQFEKDYMGQDPEEIVSFIVKDLVVVRIRGAFAPAELNLVRREDSAHWRDKLRNFSSELIEHGRMVIEASIRDIVGVSVESTFTDISETGERIIVFTLGESPTFRE